jgi:hypothetical protein
MEFDFSVFTQGGSDSGGGKSNENEGGRGTKRDAHDTILRRANIKSSASRREPVATTETTDEHTLEVEKDFGHVAALGDEATPATKDAEAADATIKITHNVSFGYFNL